MKRENLISYAASFVSFLLDEKIATSIDRIILFGSVARGEYDGESDIDIFIDSKANIEKGVSRVLALFMQSAMQKKWELKGLNNELSVKVGELNKWKLRRDIISDGIVLYGKMKDAPSNVEYYLLLRPSFKGLKKNKLVKLWRKLYGYKQKVGSKTYRTEGYLENLGGKRIESGIIIPVKNKKELMDFFNREEIPYTVNEIWSDDL